VEPLDGEVWLGDLQMMAAREVPGSSRGLYVAAWGGHNAQSHNHNDVGNVLVFLDGEPVLVDAGVGEYTSKTFSSRRYEIWTMQSGWHNLPAVNGIDQGAGAEFRARGAVFTPGRNAERLSLDIAPAYPPEAKVANWRREVRLDRAKREVVLAERYSLAGWREPIRLHFLTPRAPVLETAGRIALPGGGGGSSSAGGPATALLLYDEHLFSAAVEEKPIDDARLRPVWGDRLFRIVLTARGRATRGSHRVTVRAAR
jgi:hypothetical protein